MSTLTEIIRFPCQGFFRFAGATLPAAAGLHGLKSRKPAARLGEIIFANKVSLGGLGAERPKITKLGGKKGGPK